MRVVDTLNRVGGNLLAGNPRRDTGPGSIVSSLRVNGLAYLFLLPSLIILLVFTYYPALLAFWDSLFIKDSARPQGIFTGLGNYTYLLHDSTFHKVIINNLVFSVGTVPTSIAVGMFLAVQLAKSNRINSWMRTAFFYPVVIPLVAVANVWMFMYQPGYGLIARFLNLFGLSSPHWLTDIHLVMPAMIIMTIWKQAGFFMIFYLAGLQNIPTYVYESAEMEGASSWQTFRRITFPLLMPTTLFVLIIALTDSVKMVDQVFIMTQGGPNNASNLLLYYIYQNRFGFNDIGTAATASVIMIVILLAISMVNFFVLDTRIHYR